MPDFELKGEPINGYIICHSSSGYILYNKNLREVGIYDTEWEATSAAERLVERSTPIFL